jgi:ribonucleotide reductase alpha subunit
MYSDEVCNLGSINLERFCKESPNFHPSYEKVHPYVDWKDLEATAYQSEIFLNRVIVKLDKIDPKL